MDLSIRERACSPYSRSTLTRLPLNTAHAGKSQEPPALKTASNRGLGCRLHPSRDLTAGRYPHIALALHEVDKGVEHGKSARSACQLRMHGQNERASQVAVSEELLLQISPTSEAEDIFLSQLSVPSNHQ